MTQSTFRVEIRFHFSMKLISKPRSTSSVTRHPYKSYQYKRCLSLESFSFSSLVFDYPINVTFNLSSLISFLLIFHFFHQFSPYTFNSGKLIKSELLSPFVDSTQHNLEQSCDKYALGMLLNRNFGQSGYFLRSGATQDRRILVTCVHADPISGNCPYHIKYEFNGTSTKRAQQTYVEMLTYEQCSCPEDTQNNIGTSLSFALPTAFLATTQDLVRHTIQILLAKFLSLPVSAVPAKIGNVVLDLTSGALALTFNYVVIKIANFSMTILNFAMILINLVSGLFSSVAPQELPLE